MRIIMNSKKITGIKLIENKRNEQIQKHGYTCVGDATFNNHYQLSEAAGMLTVLDVGDLGDLVPPTGWSEELFLKMMSKPYEDRLIISGALLAAELDRINGVNYEVEMLDKKKKYDLGCEAMSLMTKLLNPEKYGEDLDCDALQGIICELSGYDFPNVLKGRGFNKTVQIVEKESRFLTSIEVNVGYDGIGEVVYKSPSLYDDSMIGKKIDMFRIGVNSPLFFHGEYEKFEDYENWIVNDVVDTN